MTDIKPVRVCALAWVVPGAGHLWLGRRRQGIVVSITMISMFAFGLALEGRLFPVVMSEPLVGLAALAQMGMGAVYFVASLLGAGVGEVTAVGYEYGNTFLITAGLLNMLVTIDAYDIAVGRK